MTDGFFAQTGVFGFQFGNNAVLIGVADGDGDEDHVLLVVHGHGVVRQLTVDLILDFVCHNLYFL